MLDVVFGCRPRNDLSPRPTVHEMRGPWTLASHSSDWDPFLRVYQRGVLLSNVRETGSGFATAYSPPLLARLSFPWHEVSFFRDLPSVS